MRPDETERIPEGDHPGSGQHAEQCGHTERATRQIHVAVAQQIPRTDPGNENRTGHIARDTGVHELGLRIRVEDQRAKVGEFHAHGDGVERRALRILHEAVGNQNPQSGQVRTDRDEVSHQQVLSFGQSLPTEHHHADEGGLHEEGHQTLDCQRCAENIAHETRVERPVGAKLELHGEACCHTENEVNQKKLAPELGHLAIDDLAGGDVDGLHGNDHETDAQGEGNE
ncbi:hypothetical protein GALL_423580 [mine drainage metagenome]|uniref:Uncharacterized protein n=1 Tax=mine drainage metagenome TaxID=410659 RepID=A0A1J5QIY0_9ZZZZ